MMSHIEAILGSLGLSKAASAGGFIGACVSLMLRTLGSLSAWQSIFAVIGGTACAAYITPLALELGSLSPRTEGAIAFLIGMFGLVWGAAIVKATPEWIDALRKKLFGRDGGAP